RWRRCLWRHSPQHLHALESPHPDCATGSRFAQEIKAVREKIESHFGGPIMRRIRPQNLRVTVTGAGFFDRIHRPTGVATNGKYQTKSFLAQCRSYTSSMLNSFAWLISHDLMR